MRIRPAGPGDIDGIATAHLASWRSGYSTLLPPGKLDAVELDERRKVWARRLAQLRAPGEVLVAESGGSVVGFAQVGPARDDDLDAAQVGELWAMYVDPTAWRCGAGRALMAAGCAHLTAAGFPAAVLWVLAGNDRALGFYEATGWEPEGSRRELTFLGVTLNELRLRRDLTG